MDEQGFTAQKVRLIGARRSRIDPILFLDAGDLVLEPGQSIIAQLAGLSSAPPIIARVVIGSGQLLESEIELEPAGAVLRPASPGDSSPGTDSLRALGLPRDWDAWLTKPAGQQLPVQQRDVVQPLPSVGTVIERLATARSGTRPHARSPGASTEPRRRSRDQRV
jgi:hypothetical protein